MDIGVLGEHLAKQRRTRARQAGDTDEARRYAIRHGQLLKESATE
jgi:hypothetical protein